MGDGWDAGVAEVRIGEGGTAVHGDFLSRRSKVLSVTRLLQAQHLL
jgi:hypothetical protein